jgi:arylformamidase
MVMRSPSFSMRRAIDLKTNKNSSKGDNDEVLSTNESARVHRNGAAAPDGCITLGRVPAARGVGPMSRPRPDLEAEYNARAAIPDHPEIFARWARESAAVRAALAGETGLAYGPDLDERLDWYPAAGTGGARPILYFIHGGYWRSLDKDDFTFLVPPLQRLGVDMVLVNYGLCPRLTIAGIVGQVRRGLAWTKDHAASRGADGERILLAGHSAGGHLVAMLLATDWAAAGRADVVAAIRGGLALSGLYDLEPLRHTSINIEARLDAATARALSPARLAPTVAAPLRLVVGGDESGAFWSQSEQLARAWPNCTAPQAVPGAHHLAVVEALADPAGVPQSQLRALVGEAG